MQAGQLIVLTGPSGVGKGTLVKVLRQKHPELYLSISATTRLPRSGEIHGKDYLFLSRQQFEAMLAANELLEWAEYAGNYYGTPKLPVKQQINQGLSVLLEIELLGAKQIKQNFPEAVMIFLLPPSMAELERRLRNRGQDTEEAVLRRLEHAQAELAAKDEFDWQIVNDQLETALEKLEEAIFPDLKSVTQKLSLD